MEMKKSQEEIDAAQRADIEELKADMKEIKAILKKLGGK